ncbi:PGN_0703 family putative restriction endonuclease [Afifella sp. YEN Y35]|uniref:PGN_0703 family putative restriction endonuclease n=1 Tax=Afifella sp. YEN Y35 TaxID=3388337 RepID=UPI0039DF83E2
MRHHRLPFSNPGGSHESPVKCSVDSYVSRVTDETTKAARATSFAASEKQSQSAYSRENFPKQIGHRGYDFWLKPGGERLNLAPMIRTSAAAYFSERRITWHLAADHALSSQACCLNFLMPLAERPEILSRLVSQALDIPPPRMLPIEAGPEGRPWYVAFEWIGGDYLNESRSVAKGTGNGGRTRGANCTSADACLAFQHQGRRETLLIEWKYTERYGAPLAPAGHEVRISRYGNLTFAPDGPIRSDLGLSLADFFYEPFYQLLRQQMLAFQMQKAHEEGAERVRILHIAPSANLALRKVTSPALRPFGRDAFAVFSGLLETPGDFVSCSTEALFRPLIDELGPDDPWASYLDERYRFLTADSEATSA